MEAVLVLAVFVLLGYGAPMLAFRVIESVRRRGNRAKNDEFAVGEHLKLLTDDSLLFEHDGVAIRVWPRAQNTAVWRVESAGITIGARFLFGHKLKKPRGFKAMGREFTCSAFATDPVVVERALWGAGEAAVRSLGGLGRMTLRLDAGGKLTLQIFLKDDEVALEVLRTFWELSALLGGDATPLLPSRAQLASAVGGATGAPTPVRL